MSVALPPLREVIARYGLQAKKALGQNFLLDPQLLARIAALPALRAGEQVYEVGPGPGGLTRALLATGARVTAVEQDRRCLPALAELGEHYAGRLNVIQGDALALPLAQALPEGGHIVSNLPYNIGTALLVRWLSEPWPPRWRSLTLMFQDEVAQRIVAKPNTSAYGRLAVLAQWRSTPRIAMQVNRAAFTPPPKVMSAVVQLVPGAAPPGVSLATLEALTAGGFGQRRKMLRQSLRTVPGAVAAAEEIRLDLSRRAETVDVEEWLALARATASLAPPPPLAAADPA